MDILKNKFPQRKNIRLKNFDYSSSGVYFVTVCAKDRKCVLSRIVGRGLAPAEANAIEYTPFGEVAKKQLLLLEERYPCLSVDKYVIMPNHIHAILILKNDTAGASPRPTIMDVVCAYKSLTARECKKIGLTEKLFQTSFYDHVIRDEADYLTKWNYVDENPLKWKEDEYYK